MVVVLPAPMAGTAHARDCNMTTPPCWHAATEPRHASLGIGSECSGDGGGGRLVGRWSPPGIRCAACAHRLILVIGAHQVFPLVERDGIRRAGRACGAMEKGLGRPRMAWMRARRAHRFIRCGGLLVALGDLLMASGMAPAMAPKALLSPAVPARANKHRSPHHPPRQLSR